MKKKSVGIIAEYNPFHNGHLFHLEESKRVTEAEVVVVVMSGNMLQRGQLAIGDKWDRAEIAVSCGADLVVELPTVFACNSAPIFASKGVEILSNLGVDYISFGSESGNIEELKSIAREMREKDLEIQDEIRTMVKEGLNYPRARREIVSRILGENKALILDNPNNILALEYIKAIEETEARRPQPITIGRKGPGYYGMEIEDQLASATAIRYLLEENKDISRLLPGKSEEIIRNSHKPSKEILFKMICHSVISQDAEKLDEIFSAGEGLGYKLKNTIRKVSSYEELLEELKSKRYTRTRLERFMIQLLLGVGKGDEYSNYIRVLAFSQEGSAYLKSVKKSGMSGIPIITNINKDIKDIEENRGARAGISKDILATDIYNMVCGRDLYRYSDFVQMPRKKSLD